jgi:hypothetical protein
MPSYLPSSEGYTSVCLSRCIHFSRTLLTKFNHELCSRRAMWRYFRVRDVHRSLRDSVNKDAWHFTPVRVDEMIRSCIADNHAQKLR